MTSPLLDFRPYKSLDREELTARIQKVRREMGRRLLILGHHYQQDDVIALSDLRGDSYKLSALAAADAECRTIVFCGVHFMAETADILANRPEQLAARGGQARRSSSPTWPPAARWPTWPRSKTWRIAGRSCRRRSTSRTRRRSRT